MNARGARHDELDTSHRRETRILKAIIALLVLAGLGTLGLRAIMRRLGTTDCHREPADIFALESACTEFEAARDGRCVLSLVDLVGPDSPIREHFSPSLPRDPWGREYRYEPPNAEFDFPRIWTYGRDGLPGGAGDDADLGNWMLR